MQTEAPHLRSWDILFASKCTQKVPPWPGLDRHSCCVQAEVTRRVCKFTNTVGSHSTSAPLHGPGSKQRVPTAHVEQDKAAWGKTPHIYTLTISLWVTLQRIMSPESFRPGSVRQCCGAPAPRGAPPSTLNTSTNTHTRLARTKSLSPQRKGGSAARRFFPDASGLKRLAVRRAGSSKFPTGPHSRHARCAHSPVCPRTGDRANHAKLSPEGRRTLKAACWARKERRGATAPQPSRFAPAAPA